MRHLALTFSMLLLGGSAHASDISFVTESYPPYVFLAKDGSVDGAGSAQVRAIMRDMGGDVGYTIEIMPWARAFALAETQPGHCVFATARTPERENRFLWVVPMLTETTLIVARRDAGIAASTTEEANDYSIGTQREDYTETLLRQAGFDRLDLSASFDVTLAKLLGGRVDLMAMSQGVYHTLVKDDVPIRSLLALSRQELGIACNRTMPDGVVERMQASLDRIRSSGEQDRIQQRYDLPPVR